VVNTLLLEYRERGWVTKEVMAAEKRQQKAELHHQQKSEMRLALKSNKLWRWMHISTADC